MTPDENFASLSGRNKPISDAPTVAFANKIKLTKEDIINTTKSTLAWYAKLFLMGFLTIAIPISVYLAQQRLDMRQQASSPQNVVQTNEKKQPTVVIRNDTPAEGTLSVEPNPCLILPSEEFCSTRVTFQFSNTPTIQICQKSNTAEEKLLWESSTPNRTLSFVHDRVATGSDTTLAMRKKSSTHCTGEEITTATLSAQVTTPTPTPRAARR